MPRVNGVKHIEVVGTIDSRVTLTAGSPTAVGKIPCNGAKLVGIAVVATNAANFPTVAVTASVRGGAAVTTLANAGLSEDGATLTGVDARNGLVRYYGPTSSTAFFGGGAAIMADFLTVTVTRGGADTTGLVVYALVDYGP